MSESTIAPKRKYVRVKPKMTMEEIKERRKVYYKNYKNRLGAEFIQQQRDNKKKHLENGTYTCYLCDKKFNCGDGLKDHNKTKYHLKIENMHTKLLELKKIVEGDK